MKLHSALLVVGVTILSACQPDEIAEAPREVIRPAKIAIAQTGEGQSGITEATRRATLAFRVSGEVIELPVLAGQELTKGALIARLDDTPYRNTLSDRHAKYQLAKTEFNRQQVLFEQKHIAESRLDTARSNFEAAEAAYKLAQDDLSYTRLVAPYDGIVSRVDIDAFQNVQRQEPIVQFQGAKNIDVVFNVPENLFLRLNENNTDEGRMKVRFDAVPDRVFDALYREHETLPDAATRSFKVTATMQRPADLTVLPGMSVTVSADLSAAFARDVQGVLLPLESVFEEADQQWVWRLSEDNIAQKTAVQVAGIEGPDLRVIQGLEAGDRVIAVGVSHVREGQKVRPMVKERGL